MKIIIVTLTLTSLIFSGCMQIAWTGYKKPVESDFVNLNAGDDCMKIGKQNLTPRQQQAVLEAATDVCNILYSQEFEQKVKSKTWIASCGTNRTPLKEMTGEKVLELLRKKIRNYSINPHKPWRAIGQTQRDENNFVYNRVAIQPSRIEGWYSNTVTVKSLLINTIAHETTHIASGQFLDAGHGSSCPEARLVSYGIGNLVEEIWLSHHTR